MTENNNVSILQRVCWICNTLFHQSYAVVSVYILWTILYNYKLTSAFSWHMFLTTLAYIPLMGEAIILFSGDNVWTQKIERTTKYWIHGVILFVSAILATAGMALMVDEKKAGHFKSKHAWTGLVSWIFILLSQILGIMAAKAQSVKNVIQPVKIKFAHNLLGILGYLFGIVSLIYGLELRSFKAVSTTDARTTAIYVLAITTAWSCLTALKSGFNQAKSITFLK